MKKTITIIIFLFLATTVHAALHVSPASGPYYVGQTIRVQTDNPSWISYNNTLSWDDGTHINNISDSTWYNHVYREPGNYRISLVSSYMYPASEYYNIAIQENRSIQVTPSRVTANVRATFLGINFNTPNSLRWVMGDGTVYTDQGSQVRHTYGRAGSYTLRVYDWNGSTNYAAVTMTVTVYEPSRMITYSPQNPRAGQTITFIGENFVTTSIDWNFGDGTIITGGPVQQTHRYLQQGNYTVSAKDSSINHTPVTITINILPPNRRISASPANPRVDQPVTFQAVDFITSSVDWNFGDGFTVNGGSAQQVHRFQNPGSFTVTAKDTSINHTPVRYTINVLPENRFITVSPPEVRQNNPVTVTAHNFRGDLIWWNFGDGTSRSGGHVENHTYTRGGTYTITARDENGESEVPFTATIRVIGLTDELTLQIAEITLDNGKYYKVIPRNSQNIQAIFRIKMLGTGPLSGYWLVDNNPFEYFNEIFHHGQLLEIRTRKNPGLPVLQPGLHTITLKLTRPGDLPITFPVLKYFVLTYEGVIELATPRDGFVAKEDTIPEFSWQPFKDASHYQIVFSNNLYPIMQYPEDLTWIGNQDRRIFTPTAETWNKIKRNQWTYWKVRGLDALNNVVAESEIRDIKVVIATANITINKITDLDGNVIDPENNIVSSGRNDLLVQGNLQYKDDSQYLILRVYADDELVDQLLFRDVKKDEIRNFETSIPNIKAKTRVMFQVLKTSSPSVIIGLQSIILKNKAH